MTSKLKRLYIVADISQSGMCGEEGRYPTVYVPIAKVASCLLPPWLTHFHRLLFTATKEGLPVAIPLMGAWWLRHHVASAGF